MGGGKEAQVPGGEMKKAKQEEKDVENVVLLKAGQDYVCRAFRGCTLEQPLLENGSMRSLHRLVCLQEVWVPFPVNPPPNHCEWLQMQPLNLTEYAAFQNNKRGKLMRIQDAASSSGSKFIC